MKYIILFLGYLALTHAGHALKVINETGKAMVFFHENVGNNMQVKAGQSVIIDPVIQNAYFIEVPGRSPKYECNAGTEELRASTRKAFILRNNLKCEVVKY